MHAPPATKSKINYITSLLGVCFWVSLSHHRNKFIVVDPAILQEKKNMETLRA
jgi:hypothetical protein